jgi:protein-disulfide isomerase
MPHLFALTRLRPQASRGALDAVTSLVLIAAAVILVWTNVAGGGTGGGEPTLPSAPVSLEGSPLKGSGSAETVMLVFADFECPYCARFARNVLPTLETDFVEPGRLDIVFRHFPLPSHSNAIKAAHSAECAGQQGHFWAMHDRLFSEGPSFSEAVFHEMASGLELDVARFVACLGDDIPDNVARDANDALRLGLRRTPTFLLGKRTHDAHLIANRIFAGLLPVAEFEREIEYAIEAKGDAPLSWLFSRLRR